MHGVAEAGSVRTSKWLRREHAAYMATPLLALDAWLSQHQETHSKRLFVVRLLLEGQSAWARIYPNET